MKLALASDHISLVMSSENIKTGRIVSTRDGVVMSNGRPIRRLPESCLPGHKLGQDLNKESHCDSFTGGTERGGEDLRETRQGVVRP